MSSEFDKKGGFHTFSCNQPGCRANYQGEPGLHRQAWNEARAHGWAYVPKYENGISKPQHFCPEHAEQFDRPRG